MLGPDFDVLRYHALRMASAELENYDYEASFKPTWHFVGDSHRRLMAAVARFMITTGTRLYERYSYAS